MTSYTLNRAYNVCHSTKRKLTFDQEDVLAAPERGKVPIPSKIPRKYVQPTVNSKSKEGLGDKMPYNIYLSTKRGLTLNKGMPAQPERPIG